MTVYPKLSVDVTYGSGPADGHRLLALSALLNIGNARALEQLATESSDRSSQQSDKVNKATQRSLAAFDLEKHPETHRNGDAQKDLLD